MIARLARVSGMIAYYKSLNDTHRRVMFLVVHGVIALSVAWTALGATIFLLRTLGG